MPLQQAHVMNTSQKARRHNGITLKSGSLSGLVAFAINLFWVYLAYQICRAAFLMEYWSVYKEGLSSLNLLQAFKGTLVFDTSAIVYTHLPYLFLMLMPFTFRNKDWVAKLAKGYYLIINAIAITANLVDVVYYAYTNRRTTCSVFAEFDNDPSQVSDAIFTELLHHWYLVVLGVALVFMLWKLYVKPVGLVKLSSVKEKIKYYGVSTTAFVVATVLCIGGARGGFAKATRPITLSNANQYVNRPCEASLILNTPFSMIRTVTKKAFTVPNYYDPKEVETVFSPVHTVNDTVQPRQRNVVVFILESFSREFVGFSNPDLDDGNYQGFTPFLDSLMAESLTFDYTFANGRKSIDAMPSILSSIPYFVEPFFLTPYSLNQLSGLAKELKNLDYHTAFFHGAQNGSMGFMAFSQATGFDAYYGRENYNEDSRFGGNKDYDGTWAIWDEPFLQYYAAKMNELQQPFMTSVFTASSHHPFKVPEQYQDRFVDVDKNPLHKGIAYTDYALKRFFDEAQKMPWYDSTLFVFTADHGNLPDHEVYRTDLGLYSVTLFIFDPSGDIKPQKRHCIAQQIDIMPTVLSYLGYNKDYIAFGNDLLTTPDDQTWAVSYNEGLFQFVKGDYMIQLTQDGDLKSIYRFKDDPLLKENLAGQHIPEVDAMQITLKAIIQSYMQRMISDDLVVK